MKYEEAFKVLTAELRKDKSDNSVFSAFQANIAMAFKDRYSLWKEGHPNKRPTNEDIHNIANMAAESFLDLICEQKLHHKDKQGIWS